MSGAQGRPSDVSEGGADSQGERREGDIDDAPTQDGADPRVFDPSPEVRHDETDGDGAQDLDHMSGV